MQQAAEGSADYHVGLGQVYFRLGRNEDGERELKTVLARADGSLAVQVGEVYRDLGLQERARQVFERVFADPNVPDELRKDAAYARSKLAEDDDETETWLGRAGDTIEVRRSLLDLQASRLLREGRDAEADAKFAEIAAAYEKEANHSYVAANNGAIAYANRYRATGDLRHLERGVELLERSVKLGGESAIATSNLGAVLANVGMLRVASRWVDVRVLRLSASQVKELLEAMLSGDLRDDVRRLLAREPTLRRSEELYRRAEVLAPQNPGIYTAQIDRASQVDDLETLRMLAARADAAPLDHGEVERWYRTWLSREKDAARLKELGAAVAIADRMLDRATKARVNAATLGAAHLVKADAHLDRYVVGDDLADLRAAVAAYREAERAWPASGARRRLGWTLVHLAIAEASSELPALAAMWKDRRAHRAARERRGVREGRVRRVRSRGRAPRVQAARAARAGTVRRGARPRAVRVARREEMISATRGRRGPRSR